MRKWLVFLLAMLVITGSVIPCCQEADCSEEVTASALTSDHQQEDHQQEDHCCSPFYICGSCVGFVQLSKPITIGVPDICRPVHHEKLLAFLSSTYSSSLFQPPRTS